MPEKRTVGRAGRNKQTGRSASTLARQKRNVRSREHGARSPQKPIGIGHSKPRRAETSTASPKRRRASSEVRAKVHDREEQSSKRVTAFPKRSRAASKSVNREGRAAASRKNLSVQVRGTASGRGPASRHQTAMKAVGLKYGRQKATAASRRRAA